MPKIKKVLIIDDDPITNYLTEELLRETQSAEEIAVAENGALAIDYLEKHASSAEKAVQLILLDINMPVMDGFEFLEKYQSYPYKDSVSVVILTSSSNQKDIEKTRKYNVAGYINKPLTEEKLIEMIREVFPIH
jgi:CheY-like chemotaxis protein